MRTVRFGVALATLLSAGAAQAKYTAAIVDEQLQITGDSASDKLAIRPSADQSHIEVDVKNDGKPDFTFDLSAFTSIQISAGAGNDTVIVDDPAFLLTAKITIDGGPGNDTLIGGPGNDTIEGGDGDDTIEGGGGTDAIFPGEGDDVILWNPGDGNYTISDNSGNDRLEFNGADVAETFVLAANGAHARLVRDVGSVIVDMAGIDELDLATLGGADTVLVSDLSATDMTHVNVDLAGAPGGKTGDGAADTVIVSGTSAEETVSIGASKGVLEVDGLFAQVRIAHAELANDVVSYDVDGPDQVHVLGSNGADHITLAPSPLASALRVTVDTFPAAVDVSGLPIAAGGQLAVFGGSGNDTIQCLGSLAGLGIPLELDGGSGNDTIAGSDGNDIIFGGSGNDTVTGGRGDDVIDLGPGNDVAIWNPGDGNDIIEAQDGKDTLQFHGSNAAEVVDVAPNGTRLSFTRSVGNVALDLNGFEVIDAALLEGADSVTVHDLTGTGVKSVTVDLADTLGGTTPDGSVDTVTVDGTAGLDSFSVKTNSAGVQVSRAGAASVEIEHADPTDQLTVNGLGGGDKLKFSSGVSSALQFSFNPN